jgi:hypothetical protein
MTETPEAAAAIIGAAGLAAYRMTLVGHAAPLVEAYRERVTKPEPGDLVVEVTSFGMHERRGVAHEAVGFLVSHGDDTFYDDAEGPWSADERRGTEEFWMVRPYVGGEPVRWTNADFISIPRTSTEARLWQSAEVSR